MMLAACGGGGGGGSGTPIGNGGRAQLSRVEYGRLVDVYGLLRTDQGLTFSLFQSDVVIGPDIPDERGTNDNTPDDQITYDFVSANPDTLQPRLFITREIGTPAFNDAFARLDANLRSITPMLFGEGSASHPYSVMPRNAAIRLTFTASLGIDDAFFVHRNAQGLVDGLRNTEAVQLLQIVGDPGNTQGTAFRALPVRIVPRDNVLILDPVLLGSEGIQYQTRNNAAGLPESPNQSGANIRLALELDGGLSIPGVHADDGNHLIGQNNAGRRSVIRDFRSGNAADDSSDLSRGFVRDPIPPRLVGEMVMYVERIDPVNAFVQEVTIFKNGINQEIDRGDVIKFVNDSTGTPVATSEVVVKPDDDAGHPEIQHVRVRVRFVPNLTDLDPRRLPGYPTAASSSNPDSNDLASREQWLVLNAPKAILVAEFSAGGRTDPNTNRVIGDDARYFVTFTPAPLPFADGTPSPVAENVSPFAGAVIRFTKPVDLDTVKSADTFFFATRNVLDQVGITDFINNRPWTTQTWEAHQGSGTGMEPTAFNADKFRTPHLVAARVLDEDGSQTLLRLQPSLGFYLDDRMRNAQANQDFRYFLHLVSGTDGIRDLAGNPIDLQADTVERSANVVFPFSLDTRRNGNTPSFADNLAISVVRRYATRDEDENPSYYVPAEVQPRNSDYQFPRAPAYGLEDLFGAVVYQDGKLLARPTSRARQVADNLNQAPVPSQTTNVRWCPFLFGGDPQISTNTGTPPFSQGGIQNPLNPFGCRLQTVWREIDLSLSRTDPFDFDLDVEQMYWAPFVGSTITFDEFDRVSLFLGNSEYRPEPCVGNSSSLATLPNSGLRGVFDGNYVKNLRAGTSIVESKPLPFAAYANSPGSDNTSMTIDPAQAVLESNHINRFLPLPAFRQAHFVHRDETVIEQGCQSGVPGDVQGSGSSYNPYIISPWLNGGGRRVVTSTNDSLTFIDSFWNNGDNYSLSNNGQTEASTDGLLGNVALPLLADFWTYCDSPDLPPGNGYVALGTNGWQISIPVQSGPQPYFRAFSAGRGAAGGTPPICIGTGNNDWNNALGGYPPGSTSRSVPGLDNSFYWIMIDFLKRTSVATSGFIDLLNPHRMPVDGASPPAVADPRLGPYLTVAPFNNPMPTAVTRLPVGVTPVFAVDFDPPLTQLANGTSLVAQFRGASVVDTVPWYWDHWIAATPATSHGAPNLYTVPGGTGYNLSTPMRDVGMRPAYGNFPLDPYKAGDAHMRKFDTRPVAGGSARNWWTYFYNRTVTSYTQDPNQLTDAQFLSTFAGPNEGFTPQDVRYLNWRFLMTNNTTANPPVSPSIDTFSLAYRFQTAR